MQSEIVIKISFPDTQQSQVVVGEQREEQRKGVPDLHGDIKLGVPEVPQFYQERNTGSIEVPSSKAKDEFAETPGGLTVPPTEGEYSAISVPELPGTNLSGVEDEFGFITPPQVEEALLSSSESNYDFTPPEIPSQIPDSRLTSFNVPETPAKLQDFAEVPQEQEVYPNENGNYGIPPLPE